MGRESEFENILDECLERMIKGETVEDCLAWHPEHADELEPLLRTALETREAIAIRPRPEFRQRAGNEFQAAVRDMQPKGSRRFFRWQVRWMAPVAIIIGLLMVGSGTVLAASSSLPDEPLYRVKLAAESVQLAFTPSSLGKAELYARFADRRVAEIVKMAEKGEVEQVEKTTERMNNQMIAMANLAGPPGGAATAILQAPVPATGETAPKALTRTAPAPAAIPAPAAAPVPAPEPTQTVEEAPSLTPAPAPVIEVPPPAEEEAPVLTTPQAPAPVKGTGPEKANAANKESVKLDKQEKLRAILSRKAAENSQVLQDELEKVPDKLKPALQRAIEVANNGYKQALSNLD
jgi:hypothetical protein